MTAVTTGRQAPQPGRPDRVPIVRVDEISKSFAGVAALRGLSLTVRSGEYLTVVADAGCGKSTLLRVIEGLTAPRRRPHRCSTVATRLPEAAPTHASRTGEDLMPQRRDAADR